MTWTNNESDKTLSRNGKNFIPTIKLQGRHRNEDSCYLIKIEKKVHISSLKKTNKRPINAIPYIKTGPEINMGVPKGCQCYLGPFGARVLFITSLIVTLTTLHNLVVKPALWRLLLPPAKLQLEHDETIYAMDEKQVGEFHWLIDLQSCFSRVHVTL